MTTLKQRKFMIKVAIFARGPTNLKGINMSVNSIIIILYHRYSFRLYAPTHPLTHKSTRPRTCSSCLYLGLRLRIHNRTVILDRFTAVTAPCLYLDLNVGMPPFTKHHTIKIKPYLAQIECLKIFGTKTLTLPTQDNG